MVRTDDFQALTQKLAFEDAEPLAKIWPKATVQGEPLLWGLPRKKKDEASGTTFVEVCGGTFTMGSDFVQKSRDGEDIFANEKPKHPVTLSAFEIHETEITRAQYEQDGKGDDTLPAVDMTWHQAKAFCEKRGWELPTEAQWEYAARGGTTSKWSFGDDEERLGNYAWVNTFRMNPVKQKKSNPLGLYDMHGNALEWVGDCYDAEAYAKRGPAANEGSTFIVNPQIDNKCKYRVLRGGWSVGGPEYLRSAPGQGRARGPVRVLRLSLCAPLAPPALTY